MLQITNLLNKYLKLSEPYPTSKMDCEPPNVKTGRFLKSKLTIRISYNKNNLKLNVQKNILYRNIYIIIDKIQ